MDDVYRIISLQYYVTSLDTLETTSLLLLFHHVSRLECFVSTSVRMSHSTTV